MLTCEPDRALKPVPKFFADRFLFLISELLLKILRTTSELVESGFKSPLAPTFVNCSRGAPRTIVNIEAEANVNAKAR